MKVVIIGGVAGGASAAARIRRLDEQAEIVVFEKSGHISYANCGLPYYVGGIIEEEGDLTLQTPESFDKRFRIQMKVKHEVLKIDPEEKTVTVKNLNTGEIFSESYDKLLISTGAKPVRPNIPGMELEELFTLRTVEDTVKIKKFIDQNNPKSAVIAGGGYIGIEMAENLKELGMDVTLVQRPKQLLGTLDADMASFVHGEMRKHGVNLLFGESAVGFRKENEKIIVMLKDGTELPTDMVILAIGVSPDTALAKEAGLALGIKDSIVVNERMETSRPDIYAVGDAVEVKHFVTGKEALIALAGPANKQGRIAADNICGKNSTYQGSQGSSVIKVFDLTAATTGIKEAEAKRIGIPYEKIVLSPMSHASYYPGGGMMTMKVLFEKESFRILGAQIVGYGGVDKRIDVLATSIRAGLSGIDLKDLDLSYAPPYSSAKDPVNMAGFMIDNIASGVMKQFHIEEIEELKEKKEAVLLDTRTKEEYDAGHVLGFKNIPVDELRDRIHEIEKGKPVYVMCQSGLRSYIASRILSGFGFDVYNFSGGYRFYHAVNSESSMIHRSYPCGMDRKS